MHQPTLIFLSLGISLCVVACHSTGSTPAKVRTPAPGEAVTVVSKATPEPAPAAAAKENAAARQAPSPWDAPRAPEHPVFHLDDNRWLAHRISRGATLAVTGEAGFVKYAAGFAGAAWRRQRRVEGVMAAEISRPAHLTMPLSPPQTEAGQLFLRAHATKPCGVRVQVNGKAAGTAQLAVGWQTTKVELTPGLLHGGENVVELAPAATMNVAWIAIGPKAPPDVPAPLHEPTQGLVLQAGGGLTWYLSVARPGLALVGLAKAEGTCQVQVTAAPAKGKPLERSGPPASIRVDLTPLQGEIVRLTLRAAGASCRQVTLHRPQLTLPGPAPQVTYPKRPKNILFWLADSFRADKLPPYNPKTRVEMPNMAALAHKGVPFWGYSQGNESRASHGSLWTGNYVVNHRMYQKGMKLTQRLTNIPRALKPSGLYTGCLTANGYVSKRWGFGESWHYFRNNLHEGGGFLAQDMARWTGKFLDQHAARRFFLFVGTIDGHVSWRGHEPWLSRYDKGYQGRFTKWCPGKTLESIIAGRIKITPRDKQRIRALYDSELSYNDHHFGVVMDKLRQLGLADDTMVIINADHGDEFWEKGRVGHGGSLYQTMVQVPVIVSYPPLIPPGRVDDVMVDSLDLLPTMCDALGIPIPADAQGESLIPLAQGVHRGYPRPSFASHSEVVHAMRLGRYKVIRSAKRSMLFDVVADPGEERNLWDSHPTERRFVMDAMAFMLAHQERWKKTQWGVASNHSARLAVYLDRLSADGKAGAR